MSIASVCALAALWWIATQKAGLPSTLRAQPVANKGRIAAALKEKVWPLFETRGLKPVIHSRFPLADAAGAHRLMESDTHIGKIVLTV